MSAAKMVADSTQADSADGDLRKRKKKMKKTGKKVALPEDEDSDLDLKREVRPLSAYLHDRPGMVEEMFRAVRGASLDRALPDLLKSIPQEELKRLCLEQLEVMSRKRIRRILAGEESANISSSGTEDDSSEEDTEPVADAAQDTSGPTEQPTDQGQGQNETEGEGHPADSTSLQQDHARTETQSAGFVPPIEPIEIKQEPLDSGDEQPSPPTRSHHRHHHRHHHRQRHHSEPEPEEPELEPPMTFKTEPMDEDDWHRDRYSDEDDDETHDESDDDVEEEEDDDEENYTTGSEDGELVRREELPSGVPANVIIKKEPQSDSEETPKAKETAKAEETPKENPATEEGKDDNNDEDKTNDDDDDDDDDDDEEEEMDESTDNVLSSLQESSSSGAKAEGGVLPSLMMDQMELLELEMRARAIKAMLSSAPQEDA